MAASVFDDLLTQVHDEERRGSAKVTVVGSGQVGMAAAFALMTQVTKLRNYLLTLPLLRPAALASPGFSFRVGHESKRK